MDEVKIFRRLVAVGNCILQYAISNGSKTPLFDFSVLSTKAYSYVWVKFLLLCGCWWGVLTAGNRVAWGGFEGVLIVWGGEWGKWGGFGVIIRVKCGLQIAVRRVWRSYQQIVNNLWKMV